MSAETFTTAMFLITAIIAAGVLVNAVFPVVYQMAGTFSSASHESDQRMRTDFKIITTFANANTQTGQVWLKNIGTTRISTDEIQRADVFCGAPGNFDRLTWVNEEPLADGQWTAELSDLNNNPRFWDSGETIKVTMKSTNIPSDKGELVYFQFVLPDGIWRSIEFTAS
jgi:flagellar protein FlaG